MIIHPDDVLIFGTGDRLTREQAEHLKAVWREKLPGLKDIMIVSGVSMLAVYREKEDQ